MSHVPNKTIAYETLPKRTLVAWELLSLCACVILFLLVQWVTTSNTLIQYLAFWLVGAIFIFVAALYLPLLYLNIGYLLGKDEVLVQSGCFVKKNQMMRRKNISFVTQYTLPFFSLFRLSALVLHAPGARLRLLFMDVTHADTMREAINKEFK